MDTTSYSVGLIILIVTFQNPYQTFQRKATKSCRRYAIVSIEIVKWRENLQAQVLILISGQIVRNLRKQDGKNLGSEVK